jgi:hypothetical protein
MPGKMVSPLISRLTLRLAIMEVKMLMAAIILHFDVEWADENQDPLADIWSQVDPVHLKLRVRALAE